MSSDDIGMAWRFLTLEKVGKLTAWELWHDPHYNRFPLNTALLYWTHVNLMPYQWPAHLLSWLLGVGLSVLFFFRLSRAGERLATSPMIAALATGIFVTSASAWQSWADLACTHYFTSFICFLAALLIRKRIPSGKYLSALLCGIGCLFSENGVFLTLQFVLLTNFEDRAKLLTRRNLNWLLLAWFPFLCSKVAIYLTFGRESLFWRNYPLQPSDVLKNIWFAFTTLTALQTWFAAIAILAIAFLIFEKDREERAETLRTSDVALILASLLLTLFPFSIFSNALQSPRIYSTLAFVSILWTGVWIGERRIVERFKFLIFGIILTVQCFYFGAYLLTVNEDSRAYLSLLQKSANSRIAKANFSSAIILNYRTRKPTELSLPWGLPLLLNDNTLRTKLLNWQPLREGARINVAFTSESERCTGGEFLPMGSMPLTVAATRTAPSNEHEESFNICAANCESCVNLRPDETIEL